MWISRDLFPYLRSVATLPIKVLKGPRQVGKTSFLERLASHQIIYLDDLAIRRRAEEDPRAFLDSLPPTVVLDEAARAPALFPELKRRVDEFRRLRDDKATPPDVWITGSNQTLLKKEVRESLAGRATYLDLNTLSAHELGDQFSLNDYLLKGGWPELYVSSELDSVRYLNDLGTTFIERDIVAAAGIEKKAAFTKVLQLAAGRVGQLLNASELGSLVGVELTTVLSWLSILVDNGIVFQLSPYFSNINKRLIKSPKLYFLDTGLTTRLQGWTELQPLLSSPLVGHLMENIVIGEVIRYFLNKGLAPELNYVRSKEKVEVDLLIHLPNMRSIALEVKSTPCDFSLEQNKLLESLDINVIEKWIVGNSKVPDFKETKVLEVPDIWDALERVW